MKQRHAEEIVKAIADNLRPPIAKLRKQRDAAVEMLGDLCLWIDIIKPRCGDKNDQKALADKVLKARTLLKTIKEGGTL